MRWLEWYNSKLYLELEKLVSDQDFVELYYTYLHRLQEAYQSSIYKLQINLLHSWKQFMINDLHRLKHMKKSDIIEAQERIIYKRNYIPPIVALDENTYLLDKAANCYDPGLRLGYILSFAVLMPVYDKILTDKNVVYPWIHTNISDCKLYIANEKDGCIVLLIYSMRWTYFLQLHKKDPSQIKNSIIIRLKYPSIHPEYKQNLQFERYDYMNPFTDKDVIWNSNLKYRFEFEQLSTRASCFYGFIYNSKNELVYMILGHNNIIYIRKKTVKTSISWAVCSELLTSSSNFEKGDTFKICDHSKLIPIYSNSAMVLMEALAYLPNKLLQEIRQKANKNF